MSLLALFSVAFLATSQASVEATSLQNELLKIGKSIYQPGVTERIEIRECHAGISHVFISPAASVPAGLPLFVSVRESITKLPIQLRVGQPASHVTSFLGRPDYEADGVITYNLSESESTLTVETDHEIIVSVTWSFYAG